MGKHLDRNQSTVQFNEHYGGRCIWGLLPLHFHRFKKLMPSTRHKHERHSKDGLKTCPTESNNGEENEAGNPSYFCYGMPCKISSHTSKASSLSGKKVVEQPRLQRTSAVHHLKPSSKYLDDNIDSMHSATEKISWESKHLTEQDAYDHGDLDEHQFGDEFSSKKYEDFFNAFKIDRNLFMRNTRKSDADECRGVVESRKKVTLRKSGSYPTGNKSRSKYGNLTPSKLEDKLIDVWPSASGSSMASTFSSSSPSSSTTSSSSSSSHQSDKIKLPRSRSMVCKLPTDGSGDGSYRRTSSLNEFMERYTTLLETSFRRDAELNPSKSLRPSNENWVDHNLSDSTMLRKVQSMSETLQVERSDSIEFPEVPNKSATQSTESYSHEQSDLEGTKDGPGTTDLQNAAHIIPDDFLQANALRTKEIIDLTDLPNALKQLLDLGTMQDSTGFHDDLEDRLLSDLVNEQLYDVYEECDAYYWPTSLCSNCHVHPRNPTEDHVFRKVLSRIQKLQGLILGASNTVKSVTAYELANSVGWMNLQVDAESLGLALEEMFFDELVEELVFELMRDARLSTLKLRNIF